MSHERGLFGPTAKHPGRILKEMLEERNWSQEELALVTGRSRGTISNIAAGKTGISADMAVTLGAAFGNEPSDWLRWDAMWELSKVEADPHPELVRKMADIYASLPIRDMQRRGWIKETEDVAELEREIEAFLGQPLEGGIQFPVATRRTMTLGQLNQAEKAWIFRARQLANALPVAPYDAARLPQLEKKLRRTAAFPKEIAKLPLLLSSYGVRFVVVEVLPNAKIDGAAFWVDGTPVIAVSVRHDRIDNFWFTVMHEFAHVKHGDAFSVDDLTGTDPDGQISILLAEDDAEKRANDEAANILVPKDEMDSFVARLSPLYPEHRIVQFAVRVKMHPGIVVGQLHRRSEIGFHAHRHFLLKVRSSITETALTDGWGLSIAPGVVSYKEIQDGIQR